MWNFGDEGSGTGVTVQHTYAQPGTYTVILTVTDASGMSATASTQMQIAGPSAANPPVANPGGPYHGYVGTAVAFNGGASTDPQGLALTYAWKFGDNSTGSGVAPTHTYTSTNTINSSPGTFAVTLIVTNSAGVSSSPVSTTASIALPPPTVTINGPYTGRPTLAVSFTSTASDIYDSDFTYLWRFGDGSTSSVADPTHTYTATGTYNVSLTVTGQYAESTTVTSTASIIAQGTGSTLTGAVKSGSAAVVGAHVYLLAANTTGYGQPSVSLLSGTAQSDAVGSYVLSGSDGSFTLPMGYSCATHSEVYVYAAGGSVGSNSNSSAAMMAALGACGYLASGSSTTVNEATTIAAAYGLSGYATDGLHVSSPNTIAALTGLANGFLNAANLVSSSSGDVLTTTPNGNGTVPQSTVDTLADIFNGCVSSSSGSSECTSLFAAASAGSATPTNTADAAINIAHNQGANVSALYAMLPTTQAYVPALTSAPHDWTLGIAYGGMLGYGTQGLAIDGSGNVWVLQYPTIYGSYPYLTELSSNGDLLLGENTTCLNGSEDIPNAIAADPAGKIWLLNSSGASYIDNNGDEQSYGTGQYCTVSNAGVMISPSGGFPLGGGINSNVSLYSFALDGNGNGFIPTATLLEGSVTGAPLNGNGYIVGNAPYSAAVALDAAGDFWVSSPGTNGLVKLSSSGALLSPANGYTGGGLSQPASVAVDHNGNVWAINTEVGYLNAGTSISELSGSGAPLSPSTGFTSNVMTTPYSLAVDGAGYVWVATGYATAVDNSVVELAPNGTVAMSIAHANELREYLDGLQSIAVDSTGSVWASNGLAYNVTQFVGVATPVVTPLAANLTAPYNGPASKP